MCLGNILTQYTLAPSLRMDYMWARVDQGNHNVGERLTGAGAWTRAMVQGQRDGKK